MNSGILKEKIPPGLAVKWFYEEVINGVDKEVLDKVYDKVADKMIINENLDKVFDYMKKERNIKEIPLFVLSLNNHVLIEKFIAKNKKYFEKYGVEIVAVMGNQVKHDKEGRISGVYEHVSNENKHQYIPDQAIMLADNRETKDLLEEEVNVLNIQGESFLPELVETSFKMRNIISLITQFRKDSEFFDNYPLVNQCYDLFFSMKIEWEAKYSAAIKEEENIWRSKNKEKLLLDIDKLDSLLAKLEEL